MKRPPGTGTVIKLGGKRRKPYAARICVGYGENSKGKPSPLYKYVGYFEKSADALACLERYNVTGSPVTPEKDREKKQRFSEVYELWLEEKKSKVNQLSKGTFLAYSVAYNHMKPIQNMAIDQIKLSDLEAITRPLSDKSAGVVKNVMTVLHGVFKYAMRHDMIEKDYSLLVEAECSGGNKRPHKPFTDEEVRILWEHADDPTVQITLCLIYTGARVMELLDATADKIHLEERYIIGGEKTDAGRDRIIPIHEKIVPFINPNDRYLFHRKNGKPITYVIYARHLKETLERIGIQKHSPHDTRHTCATKMEEAGIDSYHVKLILGHAISDITAGVYTHVKPSTLVQDINKISF